jgi:hypothetical protein
MLDVRWLAASIQAIIAKKAEPRSCHSAFSIKINCYCDDFEACGLAEACGLTGGCFFKR